MRPEDLQTERDLLSLLEEAIDLSGDARARMVERLRERDPGSAQRLSRWLEDVDGPDLLGTRDEQASAGNGDATGQRVGPYVLRERIGRGGMGDVWKADRVDGAYERSVAIKRVWADAGSLSARFQRERQLLARLQHPHIAQLLDGGVGEDGLPWFAMELVDGQPINRWCDERAATLTQRVELLRDACDAVGHAHANLVVHRDIKPGNVLVDGAGQLKLLDFGIARLLDDDDPERTQTLAMTPAWAAPEQRRGDPVTTALDIWQLGTLLRLLLSGDVGDPALGMSQSWRALRARDPAVAADIAARRGVDPARLSALLHGDLDHIVARATRDLPSERYASAGALAADLRAWLAGRPVAARRHDRGYRARRWARRWWPALAAAGIGAVAIGYHVQALQQGLAREQALRRSAQSAQRQAEEQGARAERQRERAVRLVDYYGALIAEADLADVAKGTVDLRQLLERSVARLKADTTTPAPVRADLLAAAGDALSALQRKDASNAAYAGAVQAVEAMPAPDFDVLAYVYSAAGSHADFVGERDQALAFSRKADALVQRGLVKEPDSLESVAQLRASIAWDRGDLAGARAGYQEVARVTALRPDDSRMRMSRASALTNIAKMPDTPAAEAETLLRQAEALVLKDDPPMLGTLYSIRTSLVKTLLVQGKDAEARALADPLLRDAVRFYPADNPWLGMTYNVVGRVDMKQQRWTDARERMVVAHSILLKHQGADSPLVQRVALDAAVSDLFVGDTAGAKRLLADLTPASGDAAASREQRLLLSAATAWLACQQQPSDAARERLATEIRALTTSGLKLEALHLPTWTAHCGTMLR